MEFITFTFYGLISIIFLIFLILLTIYGYFKFKEHNNGKINISHKVPINLIKTNVVSDSYIKFDNNLNTVSPLDVYFVPLPTEVIKSKK